MTNTRKFPDTGIPLEAEELDAEEMKSAIRTIDRLAEDGPVAVDPDIADAMGAFREEALTPEDALDSLFDGEDPANG
ncbi:MAG: hypothetical protein K9H25_17260 [Rhodospirillum sp.]|nr:hypothetical protein [Rhodospirillum sp.]MCF8502104.1 hypothetical protein [Rhodospirillum sp.]